MAPEKPELAPQQEVLRLDDNAVAVLHKSGVIVGVIASRDRALTKTEEDGSLENVRKYVLDDLILTALAILTSEDGGLSAESLYRKYDKSIPGRNEVECKALCQQAFNYTKKLLSELTGPPRGDGHGQAPEGTGGGKS